MNNMKTEQVHRELCARRDKEFLELYVPTLEALLEQGLPLAKARRAAVEFTLTNGHPHYHVEHERAYRCVCHLMNAESKKGCGARTYRALDDLGLAKGRLRRQMWYEITRQVMSLRERGMSVSQAIDHVLEHCRASRFYISPATALTKICGQARLRTLR